MVQVKVVAYNSGVYKIWSVGGKVTLAKSCTTGQFIGHVLASNALWHNRNKDCLTKPQSENVIVVNRFKKVNASINWFAILGSAFFAMLFVLIVSFAVVMFSINPKTVILSSLIVGLLGPCFALIIADNKHFNVEIA